MREKYIFNFYNELSWLERMKIKNESSLTGEYSNTMEINDLECILFLIAYIRLDYFLLLT